MKRLIVQVLALVSMVVTLAILVKIEDILELLGRHG